MHTQTLRETGDSSGSKVITGGTTPGTYNGIQGGIIISGGMLVLDYVANSPAAILNTANTLTFTNSSEFQFKANSSGTPGASMALNTLSFRPRPKFGRAGATIALTRVDAEESNFRVT